MNLLIDVGNTAIKLGKSENNSFTFLTRFYTKDYDSKQLNSIKKEVNSVKSIFVSSVIPNFNKKLEKDISKIFGLKPIFVNPIMDCDIRLEIDKKEELGADLFCDLVAAKSIYGDNVAIIDLGTASKVLFLKDNVFESCAIFLGYKGSLKALAEKTALIPDVDLNNVKKISDCHNTIDVITASAYYSQLDTINGIISRYENEKNCSLKRVFTGGNAANFVKNGDLLDEYLPLKGLAILSERNLQHEEN